MSLRGKFESCSNIKVQFRALNVPNPVPIIIIIIIILVNNPGIVVVI